MNIERDQETTPNPHSNAWMLLPWYANGTLSADEARQIEQHVATCALCRDEVERCRRLAVSVKAAGENAWAPSSTHFAGVMAHIDRAEGAPKLQTPPLFARLRDWFAESTRPMQWAFAVQSALVLVMAGALIFTIAPAPSTYETLSRSEEKAVSDRARLRVVFAEEVTGRELRDILQSVDGQFVQGPSPTGVYTIELPFAPTEQEKLARALAKLRSDAKVQLAEPGAAGSTP
jgi:hypothetical protein